jgi:hypothetical protein
MCFDSCLGKRPCRSSGRERKSLLEVLLCLYLSKKEVFLTFALNENHPVYLSSFQLVINLSIFGIIPNNR